TSIPSSTLDPIGPGWSGGDRGAHIRPSLVGRGSHQPARTSMRRRTVLVLQELLLPDMDGFELVVWLRALPSLHGVPIIAFSGFLSRLEYGRAAAMGF